MGAFSYILIGLGIGGLLFIPREIKKMIFYGGIILTLFGVCSLGKIIILLGRKNITVLQKEISRSKRLDKKENKKK